MKIVFFTLFIVSVSAFSQVGFNTQNPAATLDVTHKINGPAGIIAPRLTVEELIELDDQYGSSQNGAIIFVKNSSLGVGTDKTSQITSAGYYYYSAADGKWISMSSGMEPWYNSHNSLPATSNTQSIFQTGQVAVGSSGADPNAQLDVSSNSRGVLMPRLTTVQRDAIPQALANGLLVYNTTTNCFNYYTTTANKWLSLCGTYEPATFDLISCDSPSGPAGNYTKGSSLTDNNTYTLKINVTSIGTYQIVARTTNGYSFSKSGNFTQAGAQNILLSGQGTPENGPQSDAISSIEFNGVRITPSCLLPSVQVSGNTTAAAIACSSSSVKGIYYTAIATDATNYIDIPITSVITPGAALVETASINGIKFSSGSITITSSTTSIRLYAQGTPSSSGTNSYSFTVPGSDTCSVNVTVLNSKGTFYNPANKCLEILNENSSATDGYYWIQDTSNNKFKTYCDMSNGGWTLVNSRSERQMIVLDKTQSMSFASMTSKNPVTTLGGVFNEYNFSVSAAVMNNIGSNSGVQQIRILIKQNGGSGNNASEVESSTVSPQADVWAKENYWNIDILGGTNPYTQNYSSNLNKTAGKIFNVPFGKPATGNTNYTFDGMAFVGNPPGFYSSAGFFTGFYGAIGLVGNNSTANNITYNYTSDVTKSFTFNKYYINDLFGLYLNSESQLNHHIGTCSNSTDDYGGASFCNGGWANWRPHNFNYVNGNYEGRILQYYVK